MKTDNKKECQAYTDRGMMKNRKNQTETLTNYASFKKEKFTFSLGGVKNFDNKRADRFLHSIKKMLMDKMISLWYTDFELPKFSMYES